MWNTTKNTCVVDDLETHKFLLEADKGLELEK
jgi:hypothetical protein